MSRHPARFSTEVIDVVRSLLLARWPTPGIRPILHDPFAGTGERLYEMCYGRNGGLWWPYCGTEIERCFISAPGIAVGDSRDAATYPPTRFAEISERTGWIVFTSPVYANGVADNFRPRDSSERKTYRAAKIALTGNQEAELHLGNMGAYGYRGTKRPEDGGTSRRRGEFWQIANDCVKHWETASLVLLNVSDFMHSDGTIEPHVDDWSDLLAEHGWTSQTHHPVGTKRMRHGANREQRVDHEVVIVAERG